MNNKKSQVHRNKLATAEIPTMKEDQQETKIFYAGLQPSMSCFEVSCFCLAVSSFKSTIPHLKPNESKSEIPTTIIPTRIDSVTLQLANYLTSFSSFFPLSFCLLLTTLAELVLIRLGVSSRTLSALSLHKSHI